MQMPIHISMHIQHKYKQIQMRMLVLYLNT